MRALKMGAGFRENKSGQEVLQIGAALGISYWGKKITNRGKEISNRGRDYKSGQEVFQIGTGIANRGRDYKWVENTTPVGTRKMTLGLSGDPE